jgi:hypothetical protein
MQAVRPEEVLQLSTNVSEDDLYDAIGQYVVAKGAMPVSRVQRVNAAKRWCADHLSKLVCNDVRLRTIARQDVATQEVILSVCAVVDLAAHAFGAVPAATAAALIVRVGLHRFCGATWTVTEGDNASSGVD